MPIQQIKQRKIVQWLLAYLAGAWLLLQVVDLLADMYGWPVGVLRPLPVILGVGSLLVLILAWYHGEKGAQRVSAAELILIAGVLTIAGAGVALLGRDGQGAVVAAETDTNTEQGSIAVLPFADMSPGKTQAFFSDGLTEELLNVLAQIPELRVAARTSSFSFRDSKLPIDSIARALRVNYVLEGSVRTQGDQVRITAQLINAATGYHMWSETYDRQIKDIFAVQDEISSAIVRNLRLKLQPGTSAKLVQAGTADPEAHTLVLKGVHAFNGRDRAGAAKSADYFKQAIARDPNYAQAHAYLAQTYWMQAYRRWLPADEGYQLARKQVDEAIRLDPNNALAYVVRGRVLDVHDWKFGEAEAAFTRAAQINPGLADIYLNRAWLLMRLGRPQEAIADAQRATRLDPVSAAAHNSLGSMYSYARQSEAAITAYRAALELSRDASIVMANLALTYCDLNRCAEGAVIVDSLMLRAADDPYILTTHGYTHALLGHRELAEADLRKLIALPNVSSYLVASLQAALGNREEAFRLLERAVAEHDDYVPDLGVDPVFDVLRDDPRMPKLLKKIGLPTS